LLVVYQAVRPARPAATARQLGVGRRGVLERSHMAFLQPDEADCFEA